MSDRTAVNPRDERRQVWFRNELKQSIDDDEKFVPNVGDMVIDPEQGFFFVVDVDYTTGLSVLQPWRIPMPVDQEEPTDLLVALGPGMTSESYRLFIDQTVTPHAIAPEKNLFWRGSQVGGYKVFLGSDISPQYGKVISSFFDPAGNFIGTTIPVERVEQYTLEGEVIQTTSVPRMGYTTEPLQDGELVTLVAYSEDGGPVSIRQLVARNTDVIEHSDLSKRYIKGIELDSPYLSSSDPDVIEFPMNVTVESLPMTGVVHYSDGSKRRLPLDGQQFDLLGKRNYIATIVGQEFDMQLTYNLAQDEVSYTLEPTANRRLVRSYKARTAPVDGSYEVKLFVYPWWVNADVGYRLEYWLYSLDRQTYFNVTGLIELGSNSNPFVPTQYGSTQTLTVALDLNKVDSRYGPFRHVQTFQVSLLARGDNQGDNWIMYFTPDQREGYGRGLSASLEFVSVNNWNLRLDNGYPSVETWLRVLYNRIEPLINSQTESPNLLPQPTHFRVLFSNNTYEYAIEQWGDVHVVNNDLEEGELVYISWIRRLSDGDLHLGMSALPARQVL